MVNLSNSQMVIICCREWMYSNVARKYLKTNKKFKNRQAAGTVRQV